MTKESHHQEERSTIKRALNSRALEYMEQKLKELKTELDSSPVIVGDLIMPLLMIKLGRRSTKK